MIFIKTEPYTFLSKFFKNDIFLNIFVSGPKGCGKTKTIEQIHKDIGKKIIRVNVSIETDEDSLIGGFRLKNGETIFEVGPVLKAMQEGATLLLDELDQGHPSRLMCLQSILEGSSYHIKKTNQYIEPKAGFKIIATANTKGSGDETGQYIGAQLLNSAMKDRFAIFYDFKYPTQDIEVALLKEIRNDLQKLNPNIKLEDNHISKLVAWASQIRGNDVDYESVDETISTRKLIDIVKCYYVIEDLVSSIKYCVSGYPSEFVDSFMKVYDMLDDSGNVVQTASTLKKKLYKF